MLTFDVPRFSASWLRFRRIAPKLLAAVAATLVIGSLLVHTGTRPAAAAPPLPVVGLDLDTTPFIGEQVPIDLTRILQSGGWVIGGLTRQVLRRLGR